MLVTCLSPLGEAAQTAYRVTVSSGDYDRSETVVSFPLPPGVNERWQLVDPEGGSVASQVSHDGRSYFIVQHLAKGSSRAYRLTPVKADAPVVPAVQTSRERDRLKVTVNGKVAFYYQAQKSELPRPDIKPVYRRGGYIHPLLSPAGKLITDHYAPNHLHQHGMWFAWTKTEFEGRQPDFWNMGEGKGTVEFVALGANWSGPVFGGFQTQHRFVDLTGPEPKTTLNETWEVQVFHVGQGAKPFFMFDLVSTQQCATASPLKLPQYHYGGLGFRGNWAWNGKENTFFLTSEGETNRVKGNETRGRWCHIGGRVDGALAGVAILCHPGNFRAPQPMRLHPTEPFFCYAPSQLGDWEIAPGNAYVSRYRFIVADGPPDKAELERLWSDYTWPPTVTIEARGE